MALRPVSSLAVMAALLSSAHAQAPEPSSTIRYSLKQAQSSTGTYIKRDTVTGAAFPLDKPYSALSPEQRAIILSQYEDMHKDDEPPFPAGGMASIYSPLSIAQNRLRVAGKFYALVEVDSQGRAISVSVVQSPDAEMTKFVSSLLMLTKYKSAVCGGQPCRMQFPFQVTFSREL